MENKKGMTLLVECEDCKVKFEVASDTVNHKKEFKVNGESIFLTYYDCPKCGRRHFVQIDNATSFSKLNEVKQMFVKMSIARQKGNEISKKQSDKFKKSRQYLSDYRTNLMKEFTGKTAISETGISYVLRFSV